MKLYIEGELQDEDKYDEDKNLCEFLEEIRKQYLQEDEDRLMRIYLDGETVNDDLLEENPSIGEFEEIVLEYTTIVDLGLEKMEEFIELYPRVCNKLESAEADLKLGTGSRSYDLVREAMKGMYNLYDLELKLRDWDDDNENKINIEYNMNQIVRGLEIMESTEKSLDNETMLEFITDILKPMLKELESGLDYWQEMKTAIERANERDELELNK